ncbi:MAG: hypothetical protein U0270_28145 [Labilithrix sp.]
MFSVALLFVTVAACGSFGADQGESRATPSGSDGGLPDGGAGPADAEVSEEGDAGPCRAPHDLCHDFDDGATAGGGWSLTSGMAKVTPTRSLELTASTNGPALAGTLTSASAGSAGFSCSFRVQPLQLVSMAGLFATLFEARSPDGGRRVEVRLLASGGLDAYAIGPNSVFQNLSVTGTATLKQWTPINITVSSNGTGGGSFEISVGGGPVTTATIGSGAFPTDAYSAVKIGLGLNKTATSPWTIAIDDLICDRRP